MGYVRFEVEVVGSVGLFIRFRCYLFTPFVL